jgi:hypothetical protein
MFLFSCGVRDFGHVTTGTTATLGVYVINIFFGKLYVINLACEER